VVAAGHGAQTIITPLGKIQLAQIVASFPSNMTFALTKTFEKESARLLRMMAELFEPMFLSANQVDEADLLSLVKQSRQIVTGILHQHAEGLSKSELVELQSLLHIVLDELAAQYLARFHQQRIQIVNEQARRDPLTGLLNRAAFEDRLNSEVARAERYQRDLSIVMFDVDNFKSVNDNFGHQMGDRVLAAVAELLQSSFRQSDAIFRYGGDEFMAICPETSGQAMDAVLQRLDVNLQSNTTLIDLTQPINISWGHASFPYDAAEAEALIRVADSKLYSCKRERHQKTSARS